jgi:hypothetical protein
VSRIRYLIPREHMSIYSASLPGASLVVSDLQLHFFLLRTSQPKLPNSLGEDTEGSPEDNRVREVK